MTPTVRRAPRMPDGTPEVPVAIVGAGACGLTAALTLARCRARLRAARARCALAAARRRCRRASSPPPGTARAACRRRARRHARRASRTTSGPRRTAVPRRISSQAYTAAIGAGDRSRSERATVSRSSCCEASSTRATACCACTPLPRAHRRRADGRARSGGAAAPARCSCTRRGCGELWCDAADRVLGVGYRASGRRASSTSPATRPAARLQRLRRQRRDGARAAARDARRGLRRPRRQRRQRDRLGPAARRAPAPTSAATRATAPGSCRRAR